MKLTLEKARKMLEEAKIKASDDQDYRRRKRPCNEWIQLY